ncbi:MAG: pseudaminic acid cytidylyltransferase [Methylobacter sp.]
MNIAIIPARGGSKRIPRKNIKPFNGKPMLAYAIEAARGSGLFDHIVVSTDDQEITDIATEWGAKTPFVRPAELANDYTATVPVVAHGIQACRALGWEFDYACCIYPGVPFIQINDLQEALALLTQSAADYSFPVTEFPSAIQRALKRSNDGRMQPFHPEFELVRTQDLEPAYHDAGQFYWGRAEAWLQNPKIHSGGIGYVIPNWRVVDIDTPEDWLRAEALFKALQR